MQKYRSTNETKIDVALTLDNKGQCSVRCGIATLDDLLKTMVSSSAVSLRVDCDGDLWIDEHHSAEDISIAIGQALKECLGTKAGLNR